MVELFANSGGPDQIHHSAASDLGLHCFPVTLLWVRFSMCYDTQVSVTGPSWPSCLIDKHKFR